MEERIIKKELTAHQWEILNESLDILKTNDRLLIKGSAGVGKTFCVNELIKKLLNKNYGLIYCSAPTNKAVSVLREKVNNDYNIEFITTHSALKMKRFIDEKTGEKYYKPDYKPGYPPLKDVQYFIIDEASMISEEMLKYIDKYSKLQKAKVIFIGDDKQLNPVNEEHSCVFMQNYPFVELTEIVRQKGGNPIIDLSRNLNLITSGKESLNENGGYIYTMDKQKLIDELALINGTDQLKYLAYTNYEVDSMNIQVRRKIYGNPRKIEEGETMVFNEPYKESYHTNMELLINKVIIREKIFQYPVETKGTTYLFKDVTLRYYSINSMNIGDEIEDKIMVIHEDSEDQLKKISKKMRELVKISEIKWRDYYAFIEQFANLKYNHAITIHKSQGSTYKKAIINVQNVMINRSEKERLRLLYTGVTRASDYLILYNI